VEIHDRIHHHFTMTTEGEPERRAALARSNASGADKPVDD
jgi:hypothetical protein